MSLQMTLLEWSGINMLPVHLNPQFKVQTLPKPPHDFEVGYAALHNAGQTSKTLLWGASDQDPGVNAKRYDVIW